MELGLPNDTKCAYYLLGVVPKNIKKIVEICKKHNLNPQEYSTWSDIARTREIILFALVFFIFSLPFYFVFIAKSPTPSFLKTLQYSME